MIGQDKTVYTLGYRLNNDITYTMRRVSMSQTLDPSGYRLEEGANRRDNYTLDNKGDMEKILKNF
jgi:hypothetical protein